MRPSSTSSSSATRSSNTPSSTTGRTRSVGVAFGSGWVWFGILSLEWIEASSNVCVCTLYVAFVKPHLWLKDNHIFVANEP